MSFRAEDYGEVFGPLIAAAPLNELGSGRPMKTPPLSLATAFAGKRVVDESAARCCIAAILLRYDQLDESHTISQEISSAEGSYWHGIMHRREPDYSNAKYWFRRVGEHPVFSDLAAAAGLLAAGGKWDPYRFIDLCEVIARGKSDAEQSAREVARIEWELLFDFCYRRATA